MSGTAHSKNNTDSCLLCANGLADLTFFGTEVRENLKDLITVMAYHL